MINDKRIVLITGASRGIGAAVALAVAKAGQHPILVARTKGSLEEVDDRINAIGGSATLLPIDITDFNALERMTLAIAERFGRLDGLALIAGSLGRLGPVGHMPPEMFEQVIRLNVMANWYLLRVCEPLLHHAQDARVVAATDRRSEPYEPYWGVYAASKAALERLVLTFAAELANTSIKVNLIDPGPVMTKLREIAFPGVKKTEIPRPETVSDLFAAALAPQETRHGTVITL